MRCTRRAEEHRPKVSKAWLLLAYDVPRYDKGGGNMPQMLAARANNTPAIIIPGTIVSDNGKQFANNPFREWIILQGLKTRLEKAKGQWVEELPNVLWAHRTTVRAGSGCTPFSL
ncbi:reverse transcriptase domain-containing protein, partial [Tanacetum coccineum]